MHSGAFWLNPGSALAGWPAGILTSSLAGVLDGVTAQHLAEPLHSHRKGGRGRTHTAEAAGASEDPVCKGSTASSLLSAPALEAMVWSRTDCVPVARTRGFLAPAGTLVSFGTGTPAYSLRRGQQGLLVRGGESVAGELRFSRSDGVHLPGSPRAACSGTSQHTAGPQAGAPL